MFMAIYSSMVCIIYLCSVTVFGILDMEGKESSPLLEVKEQPSLSSVELLSSLGLTFEQPQKLLLLQLQHEKIQQQAEIEKQLVEKLHQQTEQAKLNLQQYRLDLIGSVTLVAEVDVELGSPFQHCQSQIQL